MLALLIAAHLTMVSQHMRATDHEVTIAMFDDAYAACREGLDHEGNVITDQTARDRACNTAHVLSVLMIEQGYCWNQETLDWKRCEASRTPGPVPDRQTNDHMVAVLMHDDAHGVCADSIDHEGTRITDKETIERACGFAHVLSVLLTEQGYCWNREKLDWKRCGVSTRQPSPDETSIDPENTIWTDYSMACIDGLGHEGEPVPKGAREPACDGMKALQELFVMKGYCYIREENRWSICG